MKGFDVNINEIDIERNISNSTNRSKNKMKHFSKIQHINITSKYALRII